jgi:WD40 repeat protein
MNYFQQLSPTRTLVTSFTPRRPADATSPFEEGDWVLCLASSRGSTAPSISCALSNGKVNVYDQQSLHPVASFSPGNSNTHIVTDLIYGPQDTLVATGQDGSVVVTDLRQPETAAIHSTLPKTGSSQESALSISLGYDGYLAAVASNKARVHFFDLRTGRVLGSYVDSHTDAVTQVAFHPEERSLLLTAGEDGLVCSFDSTQPTEELALSSVMNIGAPCRRVGFCGDSTIYCLTGSETASLWDTNTATCIEDFEGPRLRENLSSGKVQVDYLVDAHWDTTRQELFLCAGNSEGNTALYTCKDQSPSCWQVSDMLVGGHRGVVRAWCPLMTASGAFSPVIFTAGEDARLCEWNRLGRQANSITGVTSAASVRHNVPAPAHQRAGGGPVRRQRCHSKPSAAPY